MLPVEIVVWANRLIEASRTDVHSVKNQKLSVKRTFAIVVSSSSIAALAVFSNSYTEKAHGIAGFYQACRAPRTKDNLQAGMDVSGLSSNGGVSSLIALVERKLFDAIALQTWFQLPQCITQLCGQYYIWKT